MDEAEAKKLLESLKELQEDNNELSFPCPRCGHKMEKPAINNALSRHANVYICPGCSTDEGWRISEGKASMPLQKWSAIRKLLD